MDTEEIVNTINALEKLGLTGDEIVTVIKFIESADPQLLEKIPNIKNGSSKQ